MSKKLRQKHKKLKEKELARLRRIEKVVDDYCYKEMSAIECIKKIVEIVFNTN